MLPSGCKSVIGSAMWIGRSSADPTYHYWLIDTTKEATYATWDALTPQWWQDTFAIAHDLTVVHRQACPKTPPILPFEPSMFHMDMSENGVEIDPPSTNNIIKGNMLKIHFFKGILGCLYMYPWNDHNQRVSNHQMLRWHISLQTNVVVRFIFSWPSAHKQLSPLRRHIPWNMLTTKQS